MLSISHICSMLITSGYEHWAKIHNLKQAARTLNFLTENRIDSYAELSAKIAEVNAANEQAAGALKGVERRLADMAVLIKNVSTYQKTKPVYDAYRRAKDKAAYRAANESSMPGDFQNPRFCAALDRILAACHAAKKPCLVFAGDGAGAAARFAQGYDGVAMGLDATLLIGGVQAQIQAAQKQFLLS